MVTTTPTKLKPELGRTIGKLIDVVFPEVDETLSQDREFCTVLMDGMKKRIRFHDYDQVYNVPGLYEKIFYEHLGCKSPEILSDLFERELNKTGTQASSLKVLEIGAGNGLVAQQLQNMGVPKIVGLDILMEAKIAAYRDRPNLYNNYYALDLTDMPADIVEEIQKEGLNTLVSVAALGFDDIPPLAYANAFNLINEKGWVAFNIKDQFLQNLDSTGFSKLLRRMMDEGILQVLDQLKYTHRQSISGEPLDYYAIIAQKNSNIPDRWLETL